MDRQQVYIESDASLLAALKKMDEIHRKLLIVMEGDKFRSLVSIGDIQRGILRGVGLDEALSNVLRSKVFVGSPEDVKEELIALLLDQRVEFIPIVTTDQSLVDILFWEDYSKEERHQSDKLTGIPVVIMAGGQGSRLRPLTNIIPKPLVPLDKRPIIQIIIERFMDFGCRDFYISINYKGNMIKAYLDELDLDCNLHYFEEQHPMGTAGSLSLIRDQLKGDFFISNCDILIDQDFSEVMAYHQKAQNELTAIAAIKDFPIPYGVFETTDNGKLTGMVEKPSYKFQVNAGIYILNASVLELVPANSFFHITHLMESLVAANREVGVFPVSEGAWFDIGVWDEYLKTQELFQQRYRT